VVPVISLTERIFEEDEDSALLSETDGALKSDEEVDDKDKSGSHARATKKTFSRVTLMTNRVSRTSLLTTMIHGNAHASTPQNVTSRSALIPLLSPDSIRREMAARELTGSLPKGLRWERQVTRSTFNASSKRRQTTADMDGNPCSVNFDHGHQDYHSRGW